MNSGVTFSIATPTRNALAKLRRCVGSVQGPFGPSCEQLVQDACSTDGTPEWLFRQPDLKAVSEPDAGMYDAINRAWGRAQGQILSWLNSDEQYLPGTLRMFSTTLKHTRMSMSCSEITLWSRKMAVQLR